LQQVSPPPPFTRVGGIFCFLLAAAIDVAMGPLVNLGTVQGEGLINPDSYMRLVRLEEGVRAGHVVYLVARDGSGAGTLLHWTHFLEAVVLLLSAPFLGVMDLHSALHAGGVLAGPISAGLLGLAGAWAAAPLVAPGRRWMAAALMPLALAVTPYAVPGVVHHHVPVVAAIVTACGFALRAAWAGSRAGLGMGLAAGVALVLTPEAYPFLVMAFGGVVLSWLFWPRCLYGAAARTAGTAMLGVILAALLLDPPYAGYGAVEIDRISVVWVGFGLACAAAGLALFWFGRAPRGRGAALAGVAVATLALAVWIVVFPEMALGTEGLQDAELVRVMMADVKEMRPITSLGDALVFLTPGFLGLAVLLFLARRVSGAARWLALYAAVCLVAMLMLGFLHLRFSTYSAVAGVVLFPVGMTFAAVRPPAALKLLLGFLLVPPLAAGTLRLSLLLGFLSMPALLATRLLATPSTIASGGPSCDGVAAARLLAPAAGAVVLTDPTLTPELLYRTQILTAASLYHRNAAAYMRLRAAWRAEPEGAVPEAVQATRARFVLACKGAPRLALVEGLPKTTLLDLLSAGTPPAWLTAVAEDARSGFVLYRVKP
jgi:hypothetical protein